MFVGPICLNVIAGEAKQSIASPRKKDGIFAALAMTVKERSGPLPAWRGRRATTSVHLTDFWHCGGPSFSFRTGPERRSGNEPSTVLAEDCASQGSGNADSQRNGWSSGGSGARRPSPGDSGCVTAHPASWRASASYRPLRAVWAVCAWALRGCARSPDPFRAREQRIS